MYLSFMSCPEPPMDISGVGPFPVQSGGSLIIFQLFRCRNVAFNRDVFCTLVAGMWGLSARGHLYTPIHLDALCLFGCLIYLDTPCMSVCCHTFTVHLYVPLYHMFPTFCGNLGAPVHPICLGVFRSDQSTVRHFCACQYIHCLSVHNSHISPSQSMLLLYWTGCLWMSAMLHAVVPFFVVFSLCVKLLLPQL